MAVITVNGNYRDISKRYLPADKVGLKYFGIYGLDAELTRRNQLDGSVTQMAGAPVISTAHATFTNLTNYLQTTVSETAESTFVVVFRMPSAVNCNLVGNYNSPTAGGAGIPASARGTNLTALTASGVTDRVNINFAGSVNSSGTDVDVSATLTSFNVGQWYCVAGTIGADKVRSIFDLSGNRVATTPTTFPKNVGTAKHRVGSAIVSNSGSVCDIAACVIYDKAKTKAELDKLRADLSAILLPYGINI